MTSSSVAYFNDETSHKPDNLHCWFWSDSNPSALLVWKFVFIILYSYSFHNRAKILYMPSAWDLRNAAKSETCSKWLSKVSDFLEQAASVPIIITGGCNKNPGLSIFPLCSLLYLYILLWKNNLLLVGDLRWLIPLSRSFFYWVTLMIN